MALVAISHGYSSGEWKSACTKRVIRSTLAGEACAADLAADTAYFVASMFDEALIEDFRSTRKTPQTKCVVCTDCRSLYDSISKTTHTISEKRTLIDVLSVKETVGASSVFGSPQQSRIATVLLSLTAN